MQAFLKVLKREINTVIRKPEILVVIFGMPLLICVLLWQTFIFNIPRDLPIAVLNEDNSSISRTLVRMIDSTPSCEVKYDVLNLEEGKNLIIGGKAYALIVIPKNFKRDLFRITPPQIVYYYNNQAILIGGIITKDINTAVLTFAGGINVNILMKKGIPEYAAVINANPVGMDEHVRSNPYLNYCYFLCLATFIHTFQILIVAVSCWTIGRELKNGTGKEWLECANNSIVIALAGKLLPYTVCFSFVIAVVYLIYFGIFGAPFTGSIPFVVFSTFLYILAYQITPSMFVALTSNLRLALSSTAFYTALGFTFEGMTFPRMGMPLVGQAYSFLLPLSHYLAIMVDQSFRKFPITTDLHYVYSMLFLICVPLFFLPLLKKIAGDEKAWFKI